MITEKIQNLIKQENKKIIFYFDADGSQFSEILEIEVSRLKFILDEMNEHDRATLLMKYQDELSIKEMCVIFVKSESAIKMQIKRAKEKFIRIHKTKYA